MDAANLNSYILDYLDKPEILGAVMITAPWGSGKSFYINHTLLPFLRMAKPKVKVISISLYSCQTITDLCKNIILDSFLKRSDNKKMLTSAGLVAKALYHGVTSLSEIDLKLSEKDYRPLFKLLNLSNSLLILEDVERTAIKLPELFGFINNLTELDQVKILLVANEKEIFNTKEVENKYSVIKEKSIYETIQFQPLNIKTISDILKSPNYPNLQPILKEESVLDEVASVMIELRNYNLRSLKYAADKTNQLIEKFSFEADLEYLKMIFLGILAYTIRKRQNESATNNVDATKAEQLGTTKYPLYENCFHYINSQIFNDADFVEANTNFIESRRFNNTQTTLSKHLANIYDFAIMEEKAVKTSLEFFIEQPTVLDSLPASELGNLYYRLIVLESYDICKTETNACQKIIEEQIRSGNYALWPLMPRFDYIETPELKQKWADFLRLVQSNASDGIEQLFGFDYTPKSITKLQVPVKDGYFLSNRGFVCLFDIDKLGEMLKKCSSKNLQTLCELLERVYGFNNIEMHYQKDLTNLIKLKEKIEEIRLYEGYDRIQKFQIKQMYNLVNQYISSLSDSAPIGKSAMKS